MCFKFCEDDPILDENYWEHLDEVFLTTTGIVVPKGEDGDE